jgi:hypothetical protein
MSRAMQAGTEDPEEEALLNSIEDSPKYPTNDLVEISMQESWSHVYLSKGIFFLRGY